MQFWSKKLFLFLFQYSETVKYSSSMCLNFNSNSEYFQLYSSGWVCVLSSSLLVVSNINTMKLEECKTLTFLVVIFNLDYMHRDLTWGNFSSRSYITEAGKRPERSQTKTPDHPCSPPHHWVNILHDFSQFHALKYVLITYNRSKAKINFTA